MSYILRKFFKNTSKEGLMNIRRRLAIIYAFCMWNSVAMLFYVTMKDRMPASNTAERKESYKLFTGAAGHLNVYRVEGLTIKSEIDQFCEKQRKEREANQQEEIAGESLVNT